MNRFVAQRESSYVKYGEWLAEPRTVDMFANPKIIIRQTADYPIATYDDAGKIAAPTLHCIYPKCESDEISLKYVLGIINSKLIRWVFQLYVSH